MAFMRGKVQFRLSRASLKRGLGCIAWEAFPDREVVSTQVNGGSLGIIEFSHDGLFLRAELFRKGSEASLQVLVTGLEARASAQNRESKNDCPGYPIRSLRDGDLFSSRKTPMA